MGAGTRAGARARAEAGDWGRRGGGQQIWGYQGVWDDEPCQERASASRRSLQLPAVATAQLWISVRGARGRASWRAGSVW